MRSPTRPVWRALLVNAFEHSFGYYLLFPSAIVMVLLAGIVTLTTKSAE